MALNLHRIPGTKLFINVAPGDGPQWAKLATFCFYHDPDTQDQSITIEQSQSVRGTYAFLRPNAAAPFGRLVSKLASVVHSQGHLVLWMGPAWDTTAHELSVVNGVALRTLSLNLWPFVALSDSSVVDGKLSVSVAAGTQVTFEDDHLRLAGAGLDLVTTVDRTTYRMPLLNQELRLHLQLGPRCAGIAGELSPSDTATWIAAVTPQTRYMWKAGAFPTTRSSRILSANVQDHAGVSASLLLNSFSADREVTSVGLVAGNGAALTSSLIDTTRHAVKLKPAQGAAVYFEQHPAQGNYASLRGKFALDRPVAPLADLDEPTSRDVMPGSAGTEFFQFRHDDDYDGLEFVPGQPAFVQFAIGDEPSKLTDSLKTAWIAPCRTGASASWSTEPYSFVAQPQNEPLYSRRTVPSTLVANMGSADSVVYFDPAPMSVPPGVCMPFFPFRGLPKGSLEHAVRLDLEALASVRSRLAAEAKVTARSAAVRATADTRIWITTPQGLLVEIDADNEWHRIKLGEGLRWELTIDRPMVDGKAVERWALQEALTRSDVFVVVSRQTQGSIPDTSDPVLDAIKLKVDINGWALRVAFVSDSTVAVNPNDELPPLESGYAPLLVLKLSKGPLDAMLGNVGRWALARVLNQSPELASRGALKALGNLKTLADGFSPLVPASAPAKEREIAKELKKHYENLYRKITDDNWTGVLVLNAHVPFDDVPPQMLVVTEGAEGADGQKLKEFAMPALGLDLSRVVSESGNLRLDKSSAFGAIHYHSPKALDETESDFAFKLRQLNAVFDNTELRAFVASMQLRMGEFFGAETQRDKTRLVDIISRYEGQAAPGAEPAYTFRALGEYAMQFTGNAFLRELAVNRVDLTSRRLDDQTVESRFGIWGGIDFGTKFTEITGIRKIAYENAALVMRGTKTSTGDTRTFDVDFGNVRVDFKKGGGGSGLLANFPLQLSGMRWASMKLPQSLAGIGFTPLKLPGLGGIDAPSFDFGLELDLNLGSMGKLFEAVDFLKARILVGWYKSSGQDKRFSIGFRFEGGNGPLDIGVNGVMRLTAEDVNLQSYPQGIGIGLLHPQLEVMGYKVPTKKSDTLVALLPKNGSNVAWAWARLKTEVGPLELDYFAVGQRMELVPKGAWDTADLKKVVEDSKNHVQPQDSGGQATLPDIGRLYTPEAGWGVVASGAVSAFKFRFVFLDGLNRYGLGLDIPNIADIDVIYRKLSDGVGVFSAQIVPGFRTLEMGAATVTLPIVGFDALTNGNWSINIGYAGNDFSRGTTVQLLPFLGSGGIRFGKLDWRSSYVLNSVSEQLRRKLDLDPVIEMSFAARVGIGKEFREGVFAAGLTLSVYGIFEGALGRPRDPAFPPGAPRRYVKLAGTAGLLLEIFGAVNFAIVSAAVSIRVWVEVGLTLESWTPVVVHAEAGVSVFVRFVVARFKIFGKRIEIAINFRFATRVRFTQRLPYSFDGSNPYGTSIRQLALERQAALLAHEAAQPLTWSVHAIGAPTMVLTAATLEPMLSGATPVLLPMLFASDAPGDEGLADFTLHLFTWALRLSLELPPGAPVPQSVTMNTLSSLRGRLSPPRGTSLARWGAAPLDFTVLRTFMQLHLRLGLANVPAMLAAQKDAMRLAALAEPETPQGILLPWFADIAITAIANGAAPIVLRDFRSAHSQPVDAAWERRLFDRLSASAPDYPPDDSEQVKRLLVASGFQPILEAHKEALDVIAEDWAAALLQGIAHRAWEAARELVKEPAPGKQPEASLAELLDVLRAPREGGSLATQSAKHAAAFLHHGLRVPTVPDPAVTMPLAQFLRTEVPLTELGSSNDWTLGFAPRAGFQGDWITGASSIEQLAAQDADAHQRKLAADLDARKIKLTAWLEDRDLKKTTQARRFVVDSLVPMSKKGASGTVLHIATVPSALSALAQRLRELGVEPRVEEPGKPKTGVLVPSRWFVKIDVQLEQKQGAERSARPVYSVLHVDARIRTLVRRMIKGPLVEKARLAYVAKSGTGVPLLFVEEAEAFLFVSNLSKEPNPSRPSGFAAAPVALAETPTFARLGDAEALAKILWMSATVNAPGFHLAFQGVEDPIKHLFENAAIASVSMVFELKETAEFSSLIDGLLLDKGLVDEGEVLSFTTPAVRESLTTTPNGQVAVIVERDNPLYNLPTGPDDEVDLRSLAARYDLMDYWTAGVLAEVERDNVTPVRADVEEDELTLLANTDQPAKLRHRILVPLAKIAAHTAARATGVMQEGLPNPYELIGVDVSTLIEIGLRDGAGHYLDDSICVVKWESPSRVLYRDAILRLQELAGVDAQWELKRVGNDAVVQVVLRWSAANLFSTNPDMPRMAELQRDHTLAQFRRASHAMAAADFSASLEVSFAGRVVASPDVKQQVGDWIGLVCGELEAESDRDRTCTLAATLPAASWPATPKPVRMDVAVGFYRDPDLCDQRLLDRDQDGIVTEAEKKANDIASVRSPVLPLGLQTPAQWQTWAGAVKRAFSESFSLLRRLDGEVDTQASRSIGTSLWLLRRNMLTTAKVTATGGSFHAPEPLARTLRSGTVEVLMPDDQKASVEAKDVDLNALAGRAAGLLETFVSRTVGEALCQWKPGQYARVAASKRRMADAIAGRLKTIVEGGPSVPEVAARKFREASRADTRTCFAPVTVVSVEISPVPAEKTFLWGRIELAQPHSTKEGEAPRFSYSPVRIPLAASGLHGSFDFVVQWADAERQAVAVIEGPMKVRPQFVEVTGDEDVDGYVPSDWYEVIWSGELGANSTEIDVRPSAGGDWRIPLPLRLVPPTPTILRHSALSEDSSSAADLAAFVAKVRRWDYGLSLLVPSADQDVAEVSVRFGDAALVRSFSADPLFEALVSFSHLESRIDQVLAELAGTGRANENDLDRAVGLFEEVTAALSAGPMKLAATEPDDEDARKVYLRTHRSASESGFPVDLRWEVFPSSYQREVRTLLLRSDPGAEGDFPLTPDSGDAAQGRARYLERGETTAAINGTAGLSPRHVRLSPLDVLAQGRASPSVMARRNAELLGSRVTISKVFVFETPVVRSPDDLVPRLTSTGRFDLSKGSGPQSISQWICKLRDALMADTTAEKFALDVTAELKLEVTKDGSRTQSMLSPLLALKSVKGERRDWVETLASRCLRGIKLLEPNARSTGDLHLNVQVYPIGAGESQRPVLSLPNLFLPLAKVTDDAVQQCVAPVPISLPLHQVAAYVFERTRELSADSELSPLQREAIAEAAAREPYEALLAPLPSAADLASGQGRTQWAAALKAANAVHVARPREPARGSNVDIGANPAERAKQFVELARIAIQSLDGSVDAAILSFHVRTGWHEGMDLTKRTQHPTGPGRGFLQMEPGAARDAIDRAVQKQWIDKIATAASTSAKPLREAASELALGKPWPAGNLVQASLLNVDIFALMAARAYLSRGAEPIPEDLVQQSEFWEAHWHRKAAPAKKAKWLADARRLDKLLDWS